MTVQAVDSVRHLAGRPNELAALRDRVEELEAILGIADPALKLSRLPLSPIQRAILGMLYKASCEISRENIYVGLYSQRPECDQPGIRTIDALISKIRAKATKHGVVIRNIWGVGWRMDEASRGNLRLWIEGVK